VLHWMHLREGGRGAWCTVGDTDFLEEGMGLAQEGTSWSVLLYGGQGEG
jgi:hypothetical protein